MNIRNLVDINLGDGDIKHYATEDREFPVSSPVSYEGRLISSGTIGVSLSDIYFGSRVFANATITLDDTDGGIRAIWNANEMRGKAVTVKRVDIDADSVLESHYFTINTVKFAGVNNKVNIGLMPENLELFKQLIPKDKITIDDYPNALEASLGLPIPIVFGAGHEKIPCPNINYDDSASEWDYLIGYGIISDVSSVYRYLGDREWLVAESEYDFYDGSQSAPYPGFAFIRFDSQQEDANGTRYNIYCDCDGIENEGSSSSGSMDGALKQLQRLLTDAEFGLELTCNNTSFNTAQAILDGWGLTSRAYIGEQKSASEWIDQFLMVARMAQLKQGSSGYEVEIEAYNGTPVATFDEHNLKIISDTKRPYVEYISAVHFNYDRSEFFRKFNKLLKKYVAATTNIFSNDPHCVALYRFEEDAIGIDSKQGNNLTNSGATVDTDSSDVMEGEASAYFAEYGDYLYILPAKQSSNFPFKGGTTNTKMSLAGWIKPYNTGVFAGLSGKAGIYNNYMSFGIYKDTDDKLVVEVGDEDGESADAVFGVAFNCDGNHWYHIGVTIDGVTGAYLVRIWDETAQDFLDTDETGTFSASAFVLPVRMSYRTFTIGTNYAGNAANWLTSWADELALFNDILTTAEINDIRQAQYGWDDVAGIIKEYNSYFCSDSTTAARIAEFIRNKFKYQDRQIKGLAGIDAASLLNGNVLSLTNSALGLSSSLYQILNILKKANDYEILAGAYSQDIFL